MSLDNDGNDVPPAELPIGTLCLIDSQALFFAARQTFGETNRTDFLRLKLLIESELAKDPPQSYVDMKVFVVQYGDYDTYNFKMMLRGFGYSVEEKHIPKRTPGARRVEGAWTDEMISEAIAKKNRYQRFIFVAGQGAFVRAVEVLKELTTGRLPPRDKIEAWVMFFQKNLNPVLAKMADRTIILDSEVIWTIEQEEQRRWEQERDAPPKYER